MVNNSFVYLVIMKLVNFTSPAKHHSILMRIKPELLIAKVIITILYYITRTFSR